jgi:hypothetical protein
MFLRALSKDEKAHRYWSLVEAVRTGDGPRQRTLCYLGELNGPRRRAGRRRWRCSISRGESRQLKLFASEEAVARDDPQVVRVLVEQVRLERSRQLGIAMLGLGLWKQLKLDRLLEKSAGP